MSARTTRCPDRQPGTLGAVFEARTENRFGRYILLGNTNTVLKDFSFRRGLFKDMCPGGDEFVSKGLKYIQSNL